MTSDASHFVAPNLATVERCMAIAIADAGIAPAQVDAVNAHATSTKIGDKVEADALERVFGAKVPPTSANKSQLGHAMGASSAIETILAIEGMLRGTVLPTVNYEPDPAFRLDCVPRDRQKAQPGVCAQKRFVFVGAIPPAFWRRIA